MHTVFRLTIITKFYDFSYLARRLGEWGIKPFQTNLPPISFPAFKIPERNKYSFIDLVDVGFFNHCDSKSTKHTTYKFDDNGFGIDFLREQRESFCDCTPEGDELMVTYLQTSAVTFDDAGNIVQEEIIDTFYPDYIDIPTEYFPK